MCNILILPDSDTFDRWCGAYEGDTASDGDTGREGDTTGNEDPSGPAQTDSSFTNHSWSASGTVSMVLTGGEGLGGKTGGVEDVLVVWLLGADGVVDPTTMIVPFPFSVKTNTCTCNQYYVRYSKM